MSKEINASWPYGSEDFQDATGLTELGFLDPDLKLNGVPYKLTDKQKSTIESIEAQAKASPRMFRERTVSEIPGCKLYTSIVGKYYDAVLRPKLMAIAKAGGGTYAQTKAEAEATKQPQQTAAHFDQTIHADFLELLFGDEAKDKKRCPHDVMKAIAMDMHYRLLDVGRAAYTRWTKSAETDLANAQEALASESTYLYFAGSVLKLTGLRAD